jgi:ATP-binding protein involved in chromosome partitioning
MSTAPTLDAVNAVLAEFKDPETGRSVAQQGQVKDVRLDGAKLVVKLGLTSHSAPLRQDVQNDLAERLRARVPGLTDVTIDLVEHERPAMKLGQIGLTAKSVIAVGSGKGGVGKSTIAASLAFGLKKQGCRVGLMDADVYGPSVPQLLGLSGRPEIHDGKIQPANLDGLKVMSMGLLIEADQAVVWRGPMLHGAIQQFLRDTAWGELDYLVIDMPPGTGDIALTLSQLLPLSGAVAVCTPQDVALLDAVKAVAMFRKVNIPILGMVENMSYFECPDCGKRYDIFGSGGARRRAEELQIPFLGEVPINIQIRVNGDEGRIAGNYADAKTSPYLERICYQLAKNLAQVQTATAAPLPSLTVL